MILDGDAVAPFFGFMGAASALVFANIGAAYGTAKSGVGIARWGDATRARDEIRYRASHGGRSRHLRFDHRRHHLHQHHSDWVHVVSRVRALVLRQRAACLALAAMGQDYRRRGGESERAATEIVRRYGFDVDFAKRWLCTV